MDGSWKDDIHELPNYCISLDSKIHFPPQLIISEVKSDVLCNQKCGIVELTDLPFLVEGKTRAHRTAGDPLDLTKRSAT